MTNGQLFASCVAIWGSTWIAITFQLGRVAPEASVFYRFLLASLMLFAYCAARRLPLRFDRRQHAWLALLGVLMFSVSYIFVYYAEENVVSGLVAVGYSASPLLALLGMRIFFGTPMTPTLLAGALLGIAGITLVFWPEFAHLQGDRRTAIGVAHTAVAVIVSALGAMVAHRNHEAKLPLWQTMAWGMLYGALFSLVVTLGVGKPLAVEATLPYVLSLLYLSIFGSIVAFAGYLTLLHRVGATRAGYIGVMVPIVALLISSIFEHFRWHAVTLAGIVVTVAGNVIILRRK
ncbi:MAG TPA: EamA family transporter [Usitatibacter sp.]|nr:EamA family transporter [Usitatibacter sp.]